MGRIAIVDRRCDPDRDRDRIRKRGSGSGSAKDRVTNGISGKASGSGSESPIHKKDRCLSLHKRNSNIIIFIHKNINNILVLYYYIDMIL